MRLGKCPRSDQNMSLSVHGQKNDQMVGLDDWDSGGHLLARTLAVAVLLSN